MANDVYSIEEIFAGRFFTIPDYQRGYTWEKVHCMDLLDDLDLLPPKFNHYTGTIVLHSNSKEISDNEGSKYFGFDIVDGQQRLTSIVILLECIQSCFYEHPDYKTLAGGIKKKFLFANRLIDNNLFYKITLNEDCKEFFKSDILGSPGVTGATIKSHLRLTVAKTTFKEYLELKQKELDDTFFNWLIEFYDKVIHCLRAGVYIVEQAAEVGVIFEVMNNRGKDLTELEKAKNYLLYLSTKINLATRGELANLVNATWSSIYQRFMSADLGTESENQFLRAHWLIYSDYSRRNWDGSKSIKKKYSLKAYRNRDIDLFNELNAYVKSLNEASITFADIEKPERNGAFNSYINEAEKRSVVFSSTKLLRTKTIASFRSILMACRLKFPNDASNYRELVKLIEKFAFRVYNVEGKRADTGQSYILKTAYELFNEEITFETTLSNLRWLLNVHSSPTSFAQFWNFDPYKNNWYYWGALKYFLYEYEEFLAGGDPLTITWSYYTEKELENSIEHILPQTSNDPDNYWPQRFTPEQLKVYTHDLGNLCLTFNNSSYRNFGFDKKKGTPGQDKPCYANSSLNQERILTEYDEWTPEKIQTRRELITKWAMERWFVDLSEFQEITLELEDEKFGDLIDDISSSDEV